MTKNFRKWKNIFNYIAVRYFFACKDNKSNVRIEGGCINGYGTILYSNGGTATGNFVNGQLNGYCEIVWGKGKYVAKSASLFLSAIFCFYQQDALQSSNKPLIRIYDKDLTTEIVSNEEIQELSDSMQSQKKN